MYASLSYVAGMLLLADELAWNHNKQSILNIYSIHAQYMF